MHRANVGLYDGIGADVGFRCGFDAWCVLTESNRIAINSKRSLSDALTTLTNAWRESKYLVISYRIGRDRTLDQNALWFKMYERIAQMTQIGDDEDARKHCKLHFGVRIMHRDDEAFRAGWNQLLRDLPYETKLELMGSCALFGPDGFPVTRLFNRNQGVEYTESIAAAFSAKGVFFEDLLNGNKKQSRGRA